MSCCSLVPEPLPICADPHQPTPEGPRAPAPSARRAAARTPSTVRTSCKQQPQSSQHEGVQSRETDCRRRSPQIVGCVMMHGASIESVAIWRCRGTRLCTYRRHPRQHQSSGGMRLSQWVCSRIISTRWKPLHLPTLQHARIACLPGSRLTPNRCACPVRRHNQCSFATFAKLLALPAAQSTRKPGPPICLRDFTYVDASALNTHSSLTHMLYYMLAGGPGRSPGCRAVLSGGRRSGADGLTVCRKQARDGIDLHDDRHSCFAHQSPISRAALAGQAHE